MSTRSALYRAIPLAVVTLLVAACAAAGPTPSTSSIGSAVAATTDGPFRLELALPRAAWKAGEPITGRAILSFDGPTPTTLYGSSMLLNFRYTEVTGQHKVDPVSPADCATHPLDRATPISSELSKSAMTVRARGPGPGPKSRASAAGGHPSGNRARPDEGRAYE